MKISTKGRYALRILLDLALAQDEYVTVKAISQRQDISVKYMEQIISVLNKTGFVRSIRGAQGGYKLAKDPAEITVGMVLRTIEGSLAPVQCLEYEPNECPRADICPTLYVWQRLNDSINSVVDSITLQDIIENAKKI